VHRLRYSPDGSSLASVGTDGSVCFYDGGTMELRRRVENAHGNSSVYSCAWDRDGNRLLTCGADGCARLYDGATGRRVREWDLKPPSSRNGGAGGATAAGSGAGVPAGSMQLGCAFAKGNVPVSVGHDGQIAILPLGGDDDDDDDASSYPISVVTGHRAPISAMALVVVGGGAGRGRGEDYAVYTADTDGVVVEWDGRSGMARGRVVPAVDGDGDDVGGGGGGGGGANNGSAAAAAGGIHAGATVTSLAFVPDCVDDGDDDDDDEAGGGGGGGTLYSAGWDDCVRTTRGRTCDGRLRMEAQPNAMCVGTRVVVVMTVGGICLVGRRGRTGRERRASTASSSSSSSSGGLIRLPYVPTSVCLSRDDATLYVAGDDRNIHVYALSPGHVDFGCSAAAAADDPPPPPLDEMHVIEGGHMHPVQSMALSPDGTMLAAADVRDVCVYSTSCGYPAVVPRGRWCFHSQRIGCLAWSPDGTVIASGGADDSIFLWCTNAKTRRVQYRFAHRGGITGLGFVGGGSGGGGNPSSPSSSSSSVDGGEGGGDWTLVSAGADGCLNWWNVEKDVREKFGL